MTQKFNSMVELESKKDTSFKWNSKDLEVLSKDFETDKYRRNLRWIFWETILTSVGAAFSVSTITVFWNSIGMNQTQIGFVQMMFTLVILLLDIPMGYIADRFDRKKMNIIGDFGVAFTFLVYAFSKNMIMVLVSECCLGLFMAMTNGVDQAFLKYNADMVDPTGEYFKKLNSKFFTWKYITTLIVIFIGGIVGKYSLSATIGLSFIPYGLGGFFAFFIKDFGNQATVNHKNPLMDLIINGKNIFKNRKTRANLFAAMIAREITHSQIWIFSPLLILKGYSIEVVSIAWVFDSLMKIISSKLSWRFTKFKTSTKFAIPVMIELGWLLALAIRTTPVSVWLFVLNGAVVGWVSGTLITPVQESCDNRLQSTVMSILSTGSRIIYIPLVMIINFLGNIKLQLALLGVFVIFLPLCLACFANLKGIELAEKDNKN